MATQVVQINDVWRLEFSWGQYLLTNGKPSVVLVDVQALRNGEWESEIDGSVKWDGCADWHTNDMGWHWCQRDGVEVIAMAYDKAMAIMNTAVIDEESK